MEASKLAHEKAATRSDKAKRAGPKPDLAGPDRQSASFVHSHTTIQSREAGTSLPLSFARTIKLKPLNRRRRLLIRGGRTELHFKSLAGLLGYLAGF